MGRHKLPHTRKAACHRTRWAVYLDLCADCAPVTPPMQFDDRPPPLACPHCHSAPPAWHCDIFGGRCFVCGQRWERRLVAVRL